MEPLKKELTLDESIAQVMKVLPPVIRNYLAQGKYTAVAKDLMAKYGLRIDQAGVLEREIMLLLMGIENPDEFAQALTEEAKLDQKAISGIAQDINTLIFVPLREEEMKSGAMKAEPAAKPIVPAPSAAPAFGAPPLQKPRHLDNRIPPPPPRPVPPMPPTPPRPQNPALRDILAAVTKAPPMDSSKLLEDHEEPHIEFHTALQAPHPTPPQNLPGMMPPRPTPPAPPSTSGPVQPHAIAPGARAPFIAPPKVGPSPVPPPPPRPVPPPAPATPVQPRPTPPPASLNNPPDGLSGDRPAKQNGLAAAPAKPYSADPYREPIEP